MGQVKVNRAIRYQIFPNPEQSEQLVRTFGCARFVYNLGIEMMQGLHAANMDSMSKFDLKKYCNRVWKNEFVFLRSVDKCALENSIFALEKAYQKFFSKHTGYPKFKSRKNHHESYTSNYTHGNIAIDFPKDKRGDHGKVKLPYLGWVNASIYRKPEENWIIKQATVSRIPNRKYYVSILFEFYTEIHPVTPTKDRCIGLDYSSPKFYVDSFGYSPEVPKAYRKAQSRLAREQRRLSHMQKGSKNYEKQKLLIANLHAHIANQRKDFCHKTSREITNSCDVACVEDVDLRSLSMALNFGKATADNGFGMFRTFLKYKMEQEGKYYVVIDRWFPSTKTCHDCGAINPNVHLGESEWVCPVCGKKVARDFNAALNIRDEGFRILTEQIISKPA
jgi:putative transposase